MRASCQPDGRAVSQPQPSRFLLYVFWGLALLCALGVVSSLFIQGPLGTKVMSVMIALGVACLWMGHMEADRIIAALPKKPAAPPLSAVSVPVPEGLRSEPSVISHDESELEEEIVPPTQRLNEAFSSYETGPRRLAEIVKCLEEGADVNEVVELDDLVDGLCSVERAARWEDLEAAQLLVDRGGRVRPNSYLLETMIAEEELDPAMLELLLGAGASANDPVEGQGSLVGLALEGGTAMQALVPVLLTHGARPALEADDLDWASAAINQEVAPVLLEELLQACARHGVTCDFPAALVAALSIRMDYIPVLLAAGADPTVESEAGETPCRVVLDDDNLEDAMVMAMRMTLQDRYRFLGYAEGVSFHDAPRLARWVTVLEDLQLAHVAAARSGAPVYPQTAEQDLEAAKTLEQAQALLLAGATLTQGISGPAWQQAVKRHDAPRLALYLEAMPMSQAAEAVASLPAREDWVCSTRAWWALRQQFAASALQAAGLPASA
jgi:hypothetical protein